MPPRPDARRAVYRLGVTGELGTPVRLAELLGGLSVACDVANGFPHGKVVRTAALAATLARAAGHGEDEAREALYVSVLRYLGCTAFAHEEATLYGAGDDHSVRTTMAFVDPGDPLGAVSMIARGVARTAPLTARAAAIARLLGDGVAAHAHAHAQCDQARHLAHSIGASPQTVAALAHICERWDGRGEPAHAGGEALALSMRLYHVADIAELALDRVGRSEAPAVVRRRAGGALDPELAEVFLRDASAYFDLLESPDVFARFLDAEPAPHAVVDADAVYRSAEALGRFFDIKTVHTTSHSRGVAALASRAASAMGLGAAPTTHLVRAAHLHDLGRLSVPNHIWDRPGPLPFADRERVRLHAYYTERILARVPALDEAARIASAAHERLDGRGYHRSLDGAAAPREARILAACDAAHAMTERRAHREALSAARVADELRAEARAKRLDAGVVDAVVSVLDGAPAARRKTALTERELEVLRLVAAGKTNKEIAVILGLSAKTVQHHVAHAYEKIGVYSRAGATLYVIENGLAAR